MLGSPSYYYKGGVRVPAPPLAHALPAYSQQYLSDNLTILLPDFVSNLRFRQPPGAINDLMPADYEPTDQLYDQDMDYNIAPRKTKNASRFLGGLFESFLAPFLDIIKSLFGGDEIAFLRAKRAGKI